MEILCVIPARSGSKGLINKNIKPLNGKPMMVYSIECSKKSKYVNRTIVSTNSEKYAEIAKSNHAEVPFLRNENTSTDNIHSVYAVIELLEKLSTEKGYNPDITIMLLPTSPLRNVETLDLAIEKFLNHQNEVDSLISVYNLNKSKYHLREVNNHVLKPLIKTKSIPKNFQRDIDESSVCVLNGSIYISKTKSLMKNKTFHTEKATFFEMSLLESIDIDTIEDFKMAELILLKNLKK
jgi:CMP-N,N'-diacetyllegionaminic acid synthase